MIPVLLSIISASLIVKVPSPESSALIPFAFRASINPCNVVDVLIAIVQVVLFALTSILPFVIEPSCDNFVAPVAAACVVVVTTVRKSIELCVFEFTST